MSHEGPAGGLTLSLACHRGGAERWEPLPERGEPPGSGNGPSTQHGRCVRQYHVAVQRFTVRAWAVREGHAAVQACTSNWHHRCTRGGSGGRRGVEQGGGNDIMCHVQRRKVHKQGEGKKDGAHRCTATRTSWRFVPGCAGTPGLSQNRAHGDRPRANLALPAAKTLSQASTKQCSGLARL